MPSQQLRVVVLPLIRYVVGLCKQITSSFTNLLLVPLN
jgi:hypothetical protein